MNRRFSRRSLLQGSAAVAGTLAASRLMGGRSLVGTAHAQLVPEQSTVVCIYLSGGYNALFCSADSFVAQNSFSCTSNNVVNLGNGLVVDSSFGTMPQFAQQHMATIGVNHGLSGHDSANNANWSTANGMSYPVMLASAMGGTAALKCITVGQDGVPAPTPAMGSVSMQMVTDMGSTIAALGGAGTDPTVPDRAIGANVLSAANRISAVRMNTSPRSLTSLGQAYTASTAALRQPAQVFSYPNLATAYGIDPNNTAIVDFTSKMAAAELMVLAGANVVSVIETDVGWDTHGDSDGSTVRNQMTNHILPPLNAFLGRMLNAQGFNVVVAIFGEFSRSLPGSDHASNLSTTVMGKYVQVGTTGKVMSDVGLSSMPAIPEFWSFLAAAAHSQVQPFVANPHALVL
jgi:hypothetical protein